MFMITPLSLARNLFSHRCFSVTERSQEQFCNLFSSYWLCRLPSSLLGKISCQYHIHIHAKPWIPRGWAADSQHSRCYALEVTFGDACTIGEAQELSPTYSDPRPASKAGLTRRRRVVADSRDPPEPAVPLSVG